MNSILKLFIFGIMLNFSIGIMITVFPQIDQLGYKQNLPSYDPTMADGFNNNMGDTISPNGVLQDNARAMFRVLDMIHIGFVAQFIIAVERYLYGSIDFLNIMFSNMLIRENVDGTIDTSLRDILFGPSGFPIGILYILMTMGYFIGAWMLWTGKDIR
jgi:hypothetical protein